ncbi:MAG: hypothetical protein H6Q01_451 [Acidobacteria bacterium]|nr:hypothetical protein [Acidobacteriota bacterium]
MRNLLGDLMRHPAWNVAQFDRALAELSKRRSLAVRQILLLHREGRVADEVAALEVLGRLARPEDDPALASVANDPRAPESARVACALVLLGHDQPDLLTAADVTALVLRWQARFISEEPALRYPLARLYQLAPRDERAGWIALQDDELRDPEARAAMFEMLLEVERDPALRIFLLEALARTAHAAARAGLRRVVPRGSEERDLITGALAVLAAEADPGHVPDGWSARVGFCDGTGVFPLRFDFRRPGLRPRSALFLLSLDAGVRDALSLSGHEVGRYDNLAGADDDAEGPLLFEIPVPAAWAMLLEAERADLRDGRTAPRDHVVARRLLDPLADLAPRSAEPRADSDASPSALLGRSDRLLDAPGYADWCYDAGEHVLDEFRLGLLARARPSAPPDEATVTRAAEALRRAGEPRRLARLLAHNAVAHLAAGESDEAAAALAVTGALASGRFADVPLVRRLVRESLHPGHYFLAPPSEVPSRTTVMGMMLGRRRPTKARIFAVDLAWILLRAFEVWASRLPPRERPHDDRVQDAAFALAQAGTRVATRWLAGREADRVADASGRETLLAELADDYRALLHDLGWTPPAHDADLARLVESLGHATLSLLFDICLARCEARCPVHPRRLAAPEEGRLPFPAGPEAEAFVRSWPGRFAAHPSPDQASALAAVLGDGERPPNRTDAPSDGAADPAFLCPLCGEHRPAAARSRAILQPLLGGQPQPVCRRCHGIYRRDALFREQVVSRLGSLS